MSSWRDGYKLAVANFSFCVRDRPGVLSMICSAVEGMDFGPPNQSAVSRSDSGTSGGQMDTAELDLSLVSFTFGRRHDTGGRTGRGNNGFVLEAHAHVSPRGAIKHRGSDELLHAMFVNFDHGESEKCYNHIRSHFERIAVALTGVHSSNWHCANQEHPLDSKCPLMATRCPISCYVLSRMSTADDNSLGASGVNDRTSSDRGEKWCYPFPLFVSQPSAGLGDVEVDVNCSSPRNADAAALPSPAVPQSEEMVMGAEFHLKVPVPDSKSLSEVLDRIHNPNLYSKRNYVNTAAKTGIGVLKIVGISYDYCYSGEFCVITINTVSRYDFKQGFAGGVRDLLLVGDLGVVGRGLIGDDGLANQRSGVSGEEDEVHVEIVEFQDPCKILVSWKSKLKDAQVRVTGLPE